MTQITLSNGQRVSFDEGVFSELLEKSSAVMRNLYFLVVGWEDADVFDYEEDADFLREAYQYIVEGKRDKPLSTRAKELIAIEFQRLEDWAMDGTAEFSVSAIRAIMTVIGIYEPVKRQRATAPEVQSRPCHDYPFQASDSGRWQSKRSKQKNDCTVRALVNVTGLPYDEVYELLANAVIEKKIGRRRGKPGEKVRKCGQGAHLEHILKPDTVINGWKFRWVPFPAVKGQQRMHVDTFLKTEYASRAICRVPKHVYAVIDGVVIDTYQSRPDQCVYGCWLVEPVA